MNKVKINYMNWLKKYFILFLVVMALALSLCCIFLYLHKFYLFDQNSFSQFGSYVGGIVGPILTFFTIIILVVTLQMQRKELQIAKIESRKKDVYEVLKDIDIQLQNIIDPTQRVKSFLTFKKNDLLYSSL